MLSSHKTSFERIPFSLQYSLWRTYLVILYFNNSKISSALQKFDGDGPIISQILPPKYLTELLNDEIMYNKIKEIEIQYNSIPSISGFGGHLQVIGEKI